MDLVLVAAVISILLSVAAAVFGANYKRAKDKVTKLLIDIIAAVEDDKISEEELQKIVADVKAFLEK